MAIRQYIGARYVPKFMGQWNANTAYEPLSIVQDSNGNSYTSKVQVPAGVPLSNANYWFQSANFNAQIAELSEQINASNNRISSLENIDTPITAYKDSNMIVFGDSNTVFSSVDENRRWPYRVASLLGANLVNYGVGGATWQTVSGHTSILSEVNGATADSTAKLVMVMGGINDFHYADYNPSAFADAIDATLPAIHNKFPNALIITIFDAGSQMPDNNMLAYARIIMRRASGSQTNWNFNTLVIPSVDMALVTGLFYNQNHYNNAGNEMIARRILSALYGNGDSYAVSYRDTKKSFTQNAPTSTGYYGCNYHVKTIIDPVACTRQDLAVINLAVAFGNIDPTKTTLDAKDIIMDDIPVLLESGTAESYDVCHGVKRESGANVFSTVPLVMFKTVTNNPLTDDPQLSFGVRYGMPLTDVAGYSTSYRISSMN